MAKQIGFTTISGSLGETTFLNTKKGNQAREKTRSIAPYIKSSPTFARTRENNSEFARASKAAKLIKAALFPVVRTADGHTGFSLLIRKMMSIIQKDMINKRGQRNITSGPLHHLEGFRFTNDISLNSVVSIPFQVFLNRHSGVLSLTIPTFIPATSVKAPARATHFKFLTVGVELLIDRQQYIRELHETLPMVYDDNLTTSITIDHIVTPASTQPLMLALRIQFLYLVGNQMIPIMNSTVNAAGILKVDQPQGGLP